VLPVATGFVPERFVGEKREQAILDDRSSDAAAELIEAIRGSLGGLWSLAKLALESVQSRTIDFEE